MEDGFDSQPGGPVIIWGWVICIRALCAPMDLIIFHVWVFR